MLLILSSLAVTFFDVIGDLFESMLKRNRHIKDSGALLPGHGGVLDRMDGLIAVTPSFVLIVLFALDGIE
jgi:phosphatidate cytidylyltransferase